MTKREFIFRSYLWHSPVLLPCRFPGFRRLRNGFALACLSSTLGYKSPPPMAGDSYPDLWPGVEAAAYPRRV